VQRDLFGYEHPIVKRARGIARTRRRKKPVKTEKRLMKGMVTETTEERGYVVYTDLEGYFREVVEDVAGWEPAEVRKKIKCILRKAGWEPRESEHRRVEFYEPRWEV